MSGKTRLPLLDGVRGMAMVSMVAFHFCYDVFMVEGLDRGWYFRPAVFWWQQSICITFILVSGMAFQLGKRKVRRGLMVSLCGVLVTLVTVIFLPSQAIWFGILTFTGAAMLLTALLEHGLARIPAGAGLAASAALFVLFRNISDGYLGIGEQVLWRVPEKLAAWKALTPLGLPYPGFVSADYFGLLPWIFLFWAGYFGWKIVGKAPVWKQKLPFFSLAGRYSLPVYLLHQPLCMLAAGLLLKGSISLK